MAVVAHHLELSAKTRRDKSIRRPTLTKQSTRSRMMAAVAQDQAATARPTTAATNGPAPRAQGARRAQRDLGATRAVPTGTNLSPLVFGVPQGMPPKHTRDHKRNEATSVSRGHPIHNRANTAVDATRRYMQQQARPTLGGAVAEPRPSPAARVRSAPPGSTGPTQCTATKKPRIHLPRGCRQSQSDQSKNW